MKHWYAVYTQPRNEGMAMEHLARQGFEVYFPRYLKRRSHAGRVDYVPSPLFPRYLFVAFNPGTVRWLAIRSTRGVIDLVKNGLDPAPISEAVVGNIRLREDANGYVLLGKHLQLARGDKFRIESGPFAAHVGIFEAKRDHQRVVALLSLLGRNVTVSLPIEAIGPVAG
jgi:transcriptional antiterminator RfaH